LNKIVIKCSIFPFSGYRYLFKECRLTKEKYSFDATVTRFCKFEKTWSFLPNGFHGIFSIKGAIFTRDFNIDNDNDKSSLMMTKFIDQHERDIGGEEVIHLVFNK
jgi:hypothetical protein